MTTPDRKPISSPDAPRAKQRRGFAAMTPEKQRAIAATGGKASHAKGTGHEWTSESARVAGRLGGHASRGGRGRSVTQTTVTASPTTTPCDVDHGDGTSTIDDNDSAPAE
jgi:general stress protein YciG